MSGSTISEADKNAARWVPFQCPACFGLFRIQKGNTGKKGNCPQCHEILTVPDARKKNEQVPEEAAKKVAVAKTIAVAQAAGPEAPKSWSDDGNKRRKKFVGEAANKLEWEGDEREKGQSFSWMVVCSCVLMFVVLSAVGVYLVKNAPSNAGGAAPTIVGDAASAEALQKSLQLPENTSYLNEAGEDVIAKAIDDYSKFDSLKVEEAVKGFLESDTIEKRLAFVRNPEVVKPMMVRYYGGENFEPEGYEDFLRSDVNHSGNFMTFYARTSDYSVGAIAVERIEKEGEVEYQVDWESWVGYCEMPVEELIRLKPTEPKLLRIKLRTGSYYNYDYSDDKMWVAYRLEFRNSDRSLLAYIRRDSGDAETLTEIFKENENVPYTIKVRYPENARSGDQVEIVELVTQGWIEGIIDEEENE